jgi:hypothetical protein
MVRKLLYLICFVLVAMLLMPANTLAVTLLDGFDSYSTGLIPGATGTTWTVSQSGTHQIDHPSPAAIVDAGSGNKHLTYGVPAGAINDTYGVSRALPTPILNTDTVTLFLRFNADPLYANNNFGLTTAITPNISNYNDFNVQMGPRNLKFSVRNGGAFAEFAYTANVWMDVWAVIHPAGVGGLGNFDVYMKVDDGTGATLANQLIAGAKYRNALGSGNTPGQTLSFFDALSQGSATNPVALMVKLDDIYLTSGENLSIPEPATMVLLGLGSLALLKRRKS